MSNPRPANDNGKDNPNDTAPTAVKMANGHSPLAYSNQTWLIVAVRNPIVITTAKYPRLRLIYAYFSSSPGGRGSTSLYRCRPCGLRLSGRRPGGIASGGASLTLVARATAAPCGVITPDLERFARVPRGFLADQLPSGSLC